ncbi:MAG: cytochrome c peroxidase, partial [Bacteroidota bacterium]
RARLEATDFYADLFADAFGSPEVTDEGMSRALSQFIRSMVAPNSKYDQGRIGQPLTPFTWPKDNFTDQENLGLRLFYGDAECASCHFGDLQATIETFNNGLDAVTTDEGAGGGQFKSPSLRNIAVTAPYMHDGRFATLEEVVDHYDRGIQPHTNLSHLLRRIDSPPGRPSVPLRLNLTDEERAALVAFLRTLTDESFLADERWSDPFAEVVAGEDDAVQPAAVTLSAVYPNPFHDEARVQVTFAQATSATVAVYDLMGREVALLAEGVQPAGTQTLRWAAAGLASGVYLVRVQSAEGVAARTVTLSR